MKEFLVLYHWYENSSHGIIKAETKKEALIRFAKLNSKLDCNYELEKKYGYCGSISPFFYDEDKEETFEEQFEKFLNSNEGGSFHIIELAGNLEGIITDKGFYNGQDS